VRTLGSYGVPSSLPLLATAVGAVLACFVLHAAWRIARERTPALVVVAAFVAVYGLSLGYGQIATTIDPVNQRLVAPIFAPMLILAIHGLRDLQGRLVGSPLPGRLAATLRVGAAGTLLAASAVSMAQGVRFAVDASRHGIGYNRIAARTSPLALALAGLPAHAGIAASDAAQAYWTSGRSPIVQMPRADRPARTAERVRIFADRIEEHAVTYLAFFEKDEAVLTPEALASPGIRMRRVGRFADGTLWEATPRS
jgi:hypothetical protein